MSELLLNPRLQIRPVHVGDRVTAYMVTASVKGRGRLARTVAVHEADAAVINALQGLLDADKDLEIGEETCATLVDLGVLIEDHELSRPVRFACPPRSGEQQPSASLVVSPNINIFEHDDFAAKEPDLTRVLEPSPYFALATDPATNAQYPYQLSHRDLTLVQRMIPGGPPPADLAVDDIARFVGIGLLVEERALIAARERLRAATAQFALRGYAVISQILPSMQTTSLRDYYQRLMDEGYVTNGDNQVLLRSVLHNERLMRYYHRQLCRAIAQVADMPIKPSYAYFGSYRRGAILERHCDREQCKFTASILLDYTMRAGDDPAWPLHIELPSSCEVVGVELSPGDCVLFCGQVQPHHRRELRAERSTSLFLHYVDESFSGSLQ